MEQDLDAVEPLEALSCYECKRSCLPWPPGERLNESDRKGSPCTPCSKSGRSCEYPLHQLKPGPKQGSLRTRSPPRKRPRTQAQATPAGHDDDPLRTQQPVDVPAAASFSDFTYPSHDGQTRPGTPCALPPTLSSGLLARACQGLEISRELCDRLLVWLAASQVPPPPWDCRSLMIRVTSRMTLYFSNMTAFSLFSREMVDEKFSSITTPTDAEALLAAMFSFSARFEKVLSEQDPDIASSCPTPARFAHLALQKLNQSLDEHGDRTPPLYILQAYVLLAFFELIHNVRSKAWRILGQCIRIAYEMRLHLLDEDGDDFEHSHPTSESFDVEEWCQREERRRVWWAIWEMDVFASTIRRLPTAIDWNQNLTVLPVEDRHWFNKSYHKSCFLLPDPSSRWKRLLDSGNEGAKAWFILINSLMRNTQVLVYSRSTVEAGHPAEDRQVDLMVMANNLYCAVSSLPARLVYHGERLQFPCLNVLSIADEELQLHSDKYSLHLMTQLSHFMLNHHQIRSQAPWLSGNRDGPASQLTHSSPAEASNAEWTNYMSAAEEIVTVVRNSARHHYRYVNPFLVNTLWFAAAAQCSCRVFGPASLTRQRRLADSNLELLRLIIDHFINFWNCTERLKAKLARIEHGLKGLVERQAGGDHSNRDRQQQDSLDQQLQLSQQQGTGATNEVTQSVNARATMSGIHTEYGAVPDALMFGDWLPTLSVGNEVSENVFDGINDPFPFGLDDLLGPYSL